MKGSGVPQGCVLLHLVNVAALPGQGVLKGEVLSFYKARLGQGGRSWTLKLGMVLHLINELLHPFQIKLKLNAVCFMCDLRRSNGQFLDKQKDLLPIDPWRSRSPEQPLSKSSLAAKRQNSALTGGKSDSQYPKSVRFFPKLEAK